MTFDGQALKAARLKAKDGQPMSRAELSRITGVSIETIKRAEDNAHSTRLENVLAIATALSIPAERLFGLTQEKTPA